MTRTQTHPRPMGYFDRRAERDYREHVALGSTIVDDPTLSPDSAPIYHLASDREYTVGVPDKLLVLLRLHHRNRPHDVGWEPRA